MVLVAPQERQTRALPEGTEGMGPTGEVEEEALEEERLPALPSMSEGTEVRVRSAVRPGEGAPVGQYLFQLPATLVLSALRRSISS
jgi:hypothetical protein